MPRNPVPPWRGTPTDAPAPKRRGPLGWLTRARPIAAYDDAAAAESDALVPIAREWSVDRGGLPMPVKLGLLVLAVVTFGLIIWGTIYALLWLLVPMDE